MSQPGWNYPNDDDAVSSPEYLVPRAALQSAD